MNVDESTSDSELLAAAASDLGAFEAFYRRYVDRVTAVAVRRCSSAADVADVVAQTFVRRPDPAVAGPPTPPHPADRTREGVTMPIDIDTDMDDEVTVPQFKERLWLELSELHEQRRRATGSPPVVRLDRRPRRGWRGRRSVVVGAGSIAAAALLVLTQLDAGSDGEPEPAEVDLTARVLAATERAFADSVVHAVDDRETGPDSETWYDETTSAGRTRDLTPEGAPIVDFGRVTPPAPGDRAPELPPFDSPETCVPGPCTPEDLSDHPVEQVRTVCYDARRYGQWEAPMVTPVSEAERIRQMVEADMLVEDGTEVVDGRELIRLRAVPTDALPDRGAYLVDPETYRPVMYRGEPSELTDQDGQVHRFSGSVTRFEYLPRTAENLALLSPPVPDGFTQVSSEELQHIDCG